VKQYAEKQDSVLVVYNDYVLDVTTFAQHHPGGAVLLKNNNGKNI
jgi:cytochrome b involved in lipid metabolism